MCSYFNHLHCIWTADSFSHKSIIVNSKDFEMKSKTKRRQFFFKTGIIANKNQSKKVKTDNTGSAVTSATMPKMISTCLTK